MQQSICQGRSFKPAQQVATRLIRFLSLLIMSFNHVIIITNFILTPLILENWFLVEPTLVKNLMHAANVENPLPLGRLLADIKWNIPLEKVFVARNV